MTEPQLVSVHGGHSGQFCNHAEDSLEEIVLTYIGQGFSWAGITEHAPAISDELLYPGQIAAGLTPEFLLEKFGKYMIEARRLQEKYKDQITLFPAMETETYSGYKEFVPYLVERFQPDYLVGSVHFVNDHGFDYSPELYFKAARSVGGVDQLYLEYFDLQYEMIELIKPAVVGHFDLVRIFDQDYKNRILKPEIMEKVIRNLKLIKDLDLILDFNLRALLKGADEPYVTLAILEKVKELDVNIAPGDDSHGVANVGQYLKKGIKILQEMGFSTNWKCPVKN